jgi:hypothetical protein
MQLNLAWLTGERARTGQQAATYERLLQRLQLRAPRAGVVMGLPRIDEVGKYWEKDQPTPFCNIADPGRRWVLLPVGPADYRLLKEDLERRGSAELPVKIRIQGRAGRTWTGRLAQLPESEATELPLPLTHRAGGPVPVKPSEVPNVYVPQSQQYLVAVDLHDSDAAVYPGMMARVLIQCRWRTCAWWLWRTVSATFDLGLM